MRKEQPAAAPFSVSILKYERSPAVTDFLYESINSILSSSESEVMCDTIIRSFSGDQGLDPLNIELFAESFAASAMATTRMFIRNGCRNQEQIVDNICTACYKGMSAVLR